MSETFPQNPESREVILATEETKQEIVDRLKGLMLLDEPDAPTHITGQLTAENGAEVRLYIRPEKINPHALAGGIDPDEGMIGSISLRNPGEPFLHQFILSRSSSGGIDLAERTLDNHDLLPYREPADYDEMLPNEIVDPSQLKPLEFAQYERSLQQGGYEPIKVENGGRIAIKEALIEEFLKTRDESIETEKALGLHLTPQSTAFRLAEAMERWQAAGLQPLEWAQRDMYGDELSTNEYKALVDAKLF